MALISRPLAATRPFLQGFRTLRMLWDPVPRPELETPVPEIHHRHAVRHTADGFRLGKQAVQMVELGESCNAGRLKTSNVVSFSFFSFLLRSSVGDGENGLNPAMLDAFQAQASAWRPFKSFGLWGIKWYQGCHSGPPGVTQWVSQILFHVNATLFLPMHFCALEDRTDLRVVILKLGSPEANQAFSPSEAKLVLWGPPGSSFPTALIQSISLPNLQCLTRCFTLSRVLFSAVWKAEEAIIAFQIQYDPHSELSSTHGAKSRNNKQHSLCATTIAPSPLARVVRNVRIP